jgi:hypothetical protein
LANDIALVDSVFTFDVKSELDVLTGLCVRDYLFLAVIYGVDLAGDTRWHQLYMITKLNGARLDLTEDHSSSVLHFVKHRYSQRAIRVSRWDRQIIKDLQKITLVSVPVAHGGIDDLVNVFTLKA